MILLPTFRIILGMNGKILLDGGAPVSSGGVLKVYPMEKELDPGPFQVQAINIEPLRPTIYAGFNALLEIRCFTDKIEPQEFQAIIEEAGAQAFFEVVNDAVSQRLSAKEASPSDAPELPDGASEGLPEPVRQSASEQS